MYDPSTIVTLARRAEWAEPIPPTSKTLSAENATSTTGRKFSSFHAMCIVENVEATMPISNANSGYPELITNAQLNDKLTEIREQAARKVLARVFDNNPLANFRYSAFGRRVSTSGFDYTIIISTHITSLDDCFGYQVAYDVMQMMLTVQRSNGRERSIAQAGEILQQLQGYRTADGQLIEDGVAQRLESAYQTAISIFFQERTNRNIYNASNTW